MKIPLTRGKTRVPYVKMGVWGRISALPLLFPSARRFTSASGPSLCAVRKRQGEENYCWLTPVLIKQTVPTDDTSGGVEMYRDCYAMELAYPCEADGRRCGSGCLRTRPDCNRTADEDSYSNCDVVPHSGLHTIERWRNR